MIREAEAIPYAPEVLRGERLLVLAPHPDDEVIGCGGLVAQHLRDGRAVHVVVATDGAQAGDRTTRETETRTALASLGNATVAFLGYRDRELERHGDELQTRLAAVLREFRPDLIAVTSPIEIHPDHAALSRALCTLVQHDETLFADLAVARVAFYEVGQPLRPNVLVDISDVADAKYAAIALHASQLAVRDYAAYARGLNAYRAMTLAADARFAEAYFVVPLPELRTTPFSALQRRAGDARLIEEVRSTPPISVIVRTKDRAALLREALDSIRATQYPAEIIVVNDGGARPDVGDAKLIEHATSRGRSEAANAGVRAATSPFIAFLDDDDLYYPEHLATLAQAAAAEPKHTAWYSDAISAFFRDDAEESRLRLFAQDFDRDLLLLDNYIPLPTLLIPRDAFLDAGGFDPAFDLFEDWDFLIRLAQRGTFLRVPRVTCEIRHFAGGGSITLANPEGSAGFRDAKKRVWAKHRALLNDDAIANAFEAQKRHASATFSALAETSGARAQLDHEAARLTRQLADAHARIGELTIHASQLEGTAGQLNRELEAARKELEARAIRIADLVRRCEQLEPAFGEAQDTIKALYREIARQQTLLDTIFASRTWKLHTMVEKLKGRG